MGFSGFRTWGRLGVEDLQLASWDRSLSVVGLQDIKRRSLLNHSLWLMFQPAVSNSGPARFSSYGGLLAFAEQRVHHHKEGIRGDGLLSD